MTDTQTAPPADGGFISDGAFGELAADKQSLYSRTPGDGVNGSRWQLRSEFEKATPADKVEPKPGDAVDPAKMAAGDKIKVVGKDGKDFELSAADIATLLEQKATADLRKAAMPATPADYKVELPADFKPPAGIEMKLNPADPSYEAVRTWAHGKGLDQAAFSEMLGLYASHQAREHSVIEAARQRQVELLGTNGPMRITAIETFVRGLVGDELGSALRAGIFTEKAVRGWEALVKKFATQGAASFSQSHRVPNEPAGKVDEATYAKMSPAEKFNYAGSHDQSQFKQGRHGQGGEIR